MFTTVSAQVSGVDYIPIAVQIAELAIIPTGTPCPLKQQFAPERPWQAMCGPMDLAARGTARSGTHSICPWRL